MATVFDFWAFAKELPSPISWLAAVQGSWGSVRARSCAPVAWGNSFSRQVLGGGRLPGCAVRCLAAPQLHGLRNETNGHTPLTPA